MDGLTHVLHIALARKTKLPLKPGEGVITATDDRMFVGFQLLYSSLAVRHDCITLVIDLGMTDRQRRWCLGQKGLITFTPMLDTLKQLGSEGWQKLNKPYFFLASPFAKTLWLDADTMILNDVNQVFSLMDEEPVIINSNTPIPFDDWFFARMADHIPVPKYANYPNGGVIGLNLQRDMLFLHDWMAAVNYFAQNYKLSYMPNHIESALMAWALAKSGHIDVPMENPAWNWSAQGGVSEGKTINYDSPEELLVSVKHDFPIAHILHWKGKIKPWLTWGQELLDLTPHYF